MISQVYATDITALLCWPSTELKNSCLKEHTNVCSALEALAATSY